MKNRRFYLTLFLTSLFSAFLAIFIFTKAFTSFTKQEIIVESKPAAYYTSLPQYNKQGSYPDLTGAAESSVHSVVHVRTKGKSRTTQSYPDNPLFEFFFGPRGYGEQHSQPVMGSGSGVIISADGYIVTNNHVIKDATEIGITLNDNRTFDAKVIGKDPNTDIALLKIEANDLQYMKYGNSDDLRIGEWVLAVGNPFNLTSTVTAGIVSAKSRSIQILGKMSIESFIQTDAAVNPGNSGGALVDITGRLVGINTAIASQTGSYTGYSFAVPVSIVQKVVADLLEYGEVQRGLLGINIRNIDNELIKEKKLKTTTGVYVVGVMEGGGAEEAGIKEGDVIISVNGETVNTVPQLQERISRYRPGDKVNIELLRGGKSQKFAVTLRNIHGNTDIVKLSERVSILGANFEPVTDSEKSKLGIKHGLKVVKINDGKIKESGIKEGYIITLANRVPINSEEDLSKVINVLNDGLFLSGIYPNGKVAYYAINLQD